MRVMREYLALLIMSPTNTYDTRQAHITLARLAERWGLAEHNTPISATTVTPKGLEFLKGDVP